MASFFHTPKPNKLNIIPRYWDPEKEEREAKLRRIKANAGIKDDNGEAYKPLIARGEFRANAPGGKWSVSAQRRRSNTRLLVLFVILVLLVYLMLR